MATVWAVLSAMSPNKVETLFRPIKFAVDVDARRGQFSVPGIVETLGEPIRNPVTGAEHRARIELPDGFEYRVAEMGSATTRATGAIALPGLENSYAQFAHLHLSNKGVVDHPIRHHNDVSPADYYRRRARRGRPRPDREAIMATEWVINAVRLGNYNCAYG